MWKRLPRYTRSKPSGEHDIGDPVLLETTYVDNDLTALPQVGQYSSSTMPSLTADQQHPLRMAPPDRQSSTPAIYSPYDQHSPPDHYNRKLPAAPPMIPYGHHDISPPTSPELGPNDEAGDNHSSGRVSPIEPEPMEPAFSRPTAQVPRSSHIPIPRKAPANSPVHQSSTSQGDAKRAKSTGKRQPRGGTDSSNLASHAQGSAGQRRPVEAVAHSPVGNEDVPSENAASHNVHKVNPFKKPSLAERAKDIRNKALSIESRKRDPLKALGNRSSATVPVSEQPGSRNSKYAAGLRKPLAAGTHSRNDASISSLHKPVPELPSSRDSQKVIGVDNNLDEGVKPVVPLKSGTKTPPASRGLSNPSSPTDRAQDYNSPVTPDNRQRGDGREQTADEPSTAGSRSHDPPSRGRRSKSNERNHPGSRFSWTTYATGTDYQSPPPSPPPDVPKLSSSFAPPMPSLAEWRLTTLQTSNLGRKPVATNSPTPRRDSDLKALPTTPSQGPAMDLITSLQSQLDDLESRKRGIRRIIWDLNQPQNPLVLGLVERREREQRIKDFESNLADITNQEHDLGLRLHRAYKRKDKHGSEPPSALWIRRVTD